MNPKIKNYFKKLIDKKNNVIELTENDNDFLFLSNSNSGEQLIINPKKIQKAIKYINEKNILSIGINNSYFDKIENLDFLKEIPNIEHISVLQDNLDLKPIHNLVNLKSLSFGETKEKLDLLNLKNLEMLGCDYRNIENLNEGKNLKSVSLHFYNQENLIEINNLKNLEAIFLYRTNIKSFTGIENLKKLNSIELNNSPKLESLNGLPENLKILYIYNAKKLVDYEGLKKQKNIKRLQLVSGGEIENLEMFQKMSKLEYLQLGMEIKNGNKLELMSIINKKTIT